MSSCSVDAFASWSCSCLQTALDFDSPRIRNWFRMTILQRYVCSRKNTCLCHIHYCAIELGTVIFNGKNVCNAFIIVVIGIYFSRGVLAVHIDSYRFALLFKVVHSVCDNLKYENTWFCSQHHIDRWFKFSIPTCYLPESNVTFESLNLTDRLA